MAEEDVFVRVWAQASEDGFCDSVGSKEYLRVRAEWEKFQPVVVLGFILKVANAVPFDQARMASDGFGEAEGVDLAQLGREIGELPNDTL